MDVAGPIARHGLTLCGWIYSGTGWAFILKIRKRNGGLAYASAPRNYGVMHLRNTTPIWQAFWGFPWSLRTWIRSDILAVTDCVNVILSPSEVGSRQPAGKVPSYWCFQTC